MEDKLNDIERDNLRKVISRLVDIILCVAAVAAACTAAAIWFGEWRVAGLAALTWLGVVALFLLACYLAHPGSEASLAKHLRTAERAKKAKEDQRRRHVETPERGLSGTQS
ncbi:hypothetical protein DQ384_05300 [Sphaerisporangium album]|uniref:Uncharacterized protein n=1 Tax=Sphaerisporangium album TaxID=509200 RepID=A0A367FQJ7_9ACTN|nr:hypothetical protein [Sphaerisporangium album]RCG31960.1 hypothetical protein DQ384_05300 [Sphaerisporangium album]